MKRISGLCLFICLLSTAAYAQGSGSSGAISSASAERPFAVTRTVTGKVTEIRIAGKLIVIADHKGKKYELRIDGKTKFRADEKTEFGGRKDLALDDFQAGQEVRIVFRDMDKTAMMVQLRATKS